MRQLSILAIVFLVCVPAFAGDSAEGEAHKAGAGDDSQFIAYYFHGERRCKTCRTIETYSEEVIRLAYGKQIHAGTLEWKAVNMEKPENEHFVTDFGLTSSSVVLVETKGGKVERYQVLHDVWLKVRDKNDFFRYVREAVDEFIG